MLSELFHFDALAITMTVLVTFIGCIVMLYSTNYLKGDARYFKTLSSFVFLMLSVITLVASDNLILTLCAWILSNALLISIMIHKPQWQAAVQSGLLTFKTLSLGVISLASAFGLLYWRSGSLSIQSGLAQLAPSDPYVTLALILMLITAMTQSAAWPFHRWLLSSLNSPTPVSALMHAGLVNGGGFLLARFAPLYLTNSLLLHCLFIIGVISACLGTTWKLMQHDIKRMLACSTMGQMGFMLAQCGMGLFPAAISHLCYHGLFKANLFLSANNTAQHAAPAKQMPFTAITLLFAMLCGMISTYCFALALHCDWLVADTRMILIGLVFIVSTQLAISMLQVSRFSMIIITPIITITTAAFYGWCLQMIERWFASSHIMQPQPLDTIYILGYVCLFALWLAGLFKNQLRPILHASRLYRKLYMRLLNSGQPAATTITSYRNDYSY